MNQSEKMECQAFEQSPPRFMTFLGAGIPT